MWYTTSEQRARERSQARDSNFDRTWGEGVDTGGTILPDESEVVGSNWAYGVKYQGSDSVALEQTIGELPIQYEQFTFVDLGSGKGRAILVASRFPFKKIIGVEYSEQLNVIARRNVILFPNYETRCTEIDIVCADAADFPIPDGPIVIYLFHPFGKTVLQKVVQNVSNSWEAEPRRIIVIYSNAKFVDLWRDADCMQEVSARKWTAMFDTHGRKDL